MGDGRWARIGGAAAPPYRMGRVGGIEAVALRGGVSWFSVIWSDAGGDSGSGANSRWLMADSQAAVVQLVQPEHGAIYLAAKDVFVMEDSVGDLLFRDEGGGLARLFLGLLMELTESCFFISRFITDIRRRFNPRHLALF